MTLFDWASNHPLPSGQTPPTGEELKTRGMELADASEGSEWKDRADAAIRSLAASGEEFTAEDVRARAGDPSRPNAFGARFSSAAKRGLIRRVGFRNSSRPTLHSHPVAVWRGQGEG